MEQSRVSKKDVISSLQKQVLALQGHKRAIDDTVPATNLGPIHYAFPDNIFPIGAVHEFVSYDLEADASTAGFISGIAGQLLNTNGIAFWIAPKRTIFPPALKIFGIQPQRIIFMELERPKERLWAIEEALKCKSVTAVIGELRDITFSESRRLQLAVENSHVTGFIHRFQPHSEHAVACVTRWKITPLPSEVTGIPGVGLPRWNVELTKVRNGQPSTWQIEWADKSFQAITQPAHTIPQIHDLKTG